MTATGMEMASEIVRRSSAAGRAVTNVSIQKLVYFCHGWHLALKGTPLVNESFETWRFGPILPSAYYKLKVFSSNPIPADHPMIRETAVPVLEDDSNQLIDKVLELYGSYSGAELVEMSRVPTSPWFAAWEAEAANISDESIQGYFKSMMKQ